MLAYVLLVPAAQVSMHKEWTEAGLSQSDAWLRVYDEAKEWYLPALLIMLGVVMLGAFANRLALFGPWGMLVFLGASVGGVLGAMRLVKWHQEMQE
jgi:hypothetical protein